MYLWLTLAVNSMGLGGLLFLLSAGFSLIFGLMPIPNLMHGSFFMLGAYLGVSLLAGFNIKLGSFTLAVGASNLITANVLQRDAAYRFRAAEYRLPVGKCEIAVEGIGIIAAEHLLGDHRRAVGQHQQDQQLQDDDWVHLVSVR